MKWLLLVVILLTGVSAKCKETSSGPVPSKKSTIRAGEIGSTLPSFSTVDLKGRKISSSELKDKVVLINFWATWCAPCREEMPGFQKLMDQYGGQGFVVIGFKADMMSDTEDPVRFAQELGIRYTLAVGSEDIQTKFGGILGLPTTFVYDRQGILRNKIIGFEYTATIDKIIKALL